MIRCIEGILEEIKSVIMSPVMDGNMHETLSLENGSLVVPSIMGDAVTDSICMCPVLKVFHN